MKEGNDVSSKVHLFFFFSCGLAFQSEYGENKLGFVDLDSPTQLADRKSNILLVKTNSSVNEVNDNVLATSKVTD